MSNNPKDSRLAHSFESAVPGQPVGAAAGLQAALGDISFRTNDALNALTPPSVVPRDRRAALSESLQQFGVNRVRGTRFTESDSDLDPIPRGRHRITDAMIDEGIERLLAETTLPRGSTAARAPPLRNLGAIPKSKRSLVDNDRDSDDAPVDATNVDTRRRDLDASRSARRNLADTLRDVDSDSYELVKAFREENAELKQRLERVESLLRAEAPNRQRLFRQTRALPAAPRTVDLGMAMKHIPRFTGGSADELDQFFRACDTAFNRIAYEDHEILLDFVISGNISGRPAQELKHKSIHTLAELKAELLMLYGKRKSLAALQMEFCSLRQGQGESVTTYAGRAEQLTVELIGKLCEEVSTPGEARTIETVTRKCAQANFENGLHGQVQVLVRARNFPTLHESVVGAIEISNMIQPSGTRSAQGGNQRRSLPPQHNNYGSYNNNSNACSKCGSRAHQSRYCPRQSGRHSLPMPDNNRTLHQLEVVCHYCQKKGHLKKDCRKRIADEGNHGRQNGEQSYQQNHYQQGNRDKQSQNNKKKNNNNQNNYRKNDQQKAGKNDAPTKLTLGALSINLLSVCTDDTASNVTEPEETLQIMQVSIPSETSASDFDIESPSAPGGVVTLKADTGAQCCVIKRGCLLPGTTIEKTKTILKGISGRTFQPICKAEIILDVPAVSIRHWFYVVNDDVPISVNGLLGMDFIRKHHADILGGEIFKLYGHSMPLIEGSEKITLPPRSETIVHGKTKSKTIGFVEKFELDREILVGACVTPPRGSSCTVSIMNARESAYTVLRPTVQLEPLEDNAAEALSVATVRAGRGAERLDRLRDELDLAHLNAEEKLSIEELIQNFEDVFHLPGDVLPCTNMVEHCIVLKEGTLPMKVHPYRLPEAHKKEVERQTEEMLTDGIIQPSKSQWNAPLLVVAKKPDANGQRRMRVVVDFRKLNEATIGDSYPLPNINEILDQLGRARYFSTLDLASGFHQIPMAEEDKKKTAFSTPQGHFEYNRMPFGLKNAPPTFQRLMNAVLAGLDGIKCYVYLDDIVIHGKTLQEHNGRLKEVLQRLREAKLVLQPSKCRLLRKETHYLGHIISEKGVQADPEKIAAVKNFPIPTNVKGVQSFLGLAGYYRKFIKDFSKVAKPLTELVRKDATFEWTAIRDAAFEELKNAMTTAPILQYPDFKKPFVVTTDASDKAIGAILSQGKVGEDLPICYASRTLSKAELNYTTTEKELLAIVWAITQFRPYVYGTRFKVVTDHQPLTWLFGVKDPGSRLMRWRIKLSEHEFDIEYKAGKRNTNADALSRICVTTRARERETKIASASAKDGNTHLRQAKSANAPGDSTVKTHGGSGDNTKHSTKETSETRERSPASEREVRDVTPPSSTTEASGRGAGSTNSRTKGRPAKTERAATSSRKREASETSSAAENKIKNYAAALPPKAGEEAESGADSDASSLPGEDGDSHIEKECGLRTGVTCPRPEDRARILHEYHDAPLGGHQGIKRTLSRIRTKYEWPGIKKDVENHVNGCIKCQKNKLSRKERVPMVITDTPEKAFEKVAVDIVGPLPETPRGNKYILTFQDALTKYSAAMAIENQEANTVAKALVKEVICRYGMPETILSDQGTNFLSQTFKEICRLLRIQKIQTTAYHPESNGALERSHRTLAEYLRHFIEEDQCDWDEWLPYAMFTYNTTPHTATGLSPHELTFGRAAVLPTAVKQEPRSTYSYDDYADELRERLRATWSIARSNLLHAKEKAKINYDKKTTEAIFHAGDRVLLHDETLRRGRSAKLTPKWTGPFQVTEQRTPVTYRIKKGKKDLTVHANRLKLVVDH